MTHPPGPAPARPESGGDDEELALPESIRSPAGLPTIAVPGGQATPPALVPLDPTAMLPPDEDVAAEFGARETVMIPDEEPPEGEDVGAFVARIVGRTVAVRLTPPPRSRQSGTIRGALGRYPIRGTIGAGGMGDILQVEDPELGRTLAAKLIRPGVSPEALAKFVLEAQITGQLQHPNVVPVHDLGVADEGRVFFTMKQVEGQTLEELIGEADGAGSSLIELLQVFLKICDGVGYAHAHGVIHRDLKPENVMVGRFGEVQVMDWGIAKVVGREEPAADPAEPPAGASADASAGATVDGTIMGTPAYMPPEQALGKIDQLDQRSDIYSLGGLLYQILTLKPPFVPGGRTLMVLLEEVAQGELIAPTRRAPDRAIPWELEAVVLKAMARRRMDRYPTVAALRADVVRFLEGRALSAARYSRLQLALKWLQRHRVAVAIGVLLVVVAGLGGRWALERARRARQFASLSADAHAAFEARRWTDALVACQRAVDLREAPELATMATRCQAEIAADADRKARRLAEAARFRTRQQLMRPLAAVIEDTRPLFYIARVDIAAKLVQVEQALAPLVTLSLNPHHARAPELWALLGAGWSFVGHQHEASAALGRAVALKSTDPRVRYHLGRTYLERALAARQSYEEGEGSPIHAIWTQKAAEQLALADAGDDGFQAHLGQTYLALARGERATVLTRCTEGLKRFADHLEAVDYWLIRAWAQVGSSSVEAIAAVDQVLAWRPHDAQAHFLRGSLWLREGDPAAARKDLDAALRINPRLAPAYFMRGLLHALRKEPEAAVREYDRAIELHPGYVLAYYNRGNAWLARNNLARAIADYSRALELHPSHWRALLNRATVRNKRRDLKGALADSQAATRVAPGQWECWHNHGLLLGRLGRRADARAALTKALERAPADRRAIVEAALRRHR